jgi:hypothetical protein
MQETRTVVHGETEKEICFAEFEYHPLYDVQKFESCNMQHRYDIMPYILYKNDTLSMTVKESTTENLPGDNLDSEEV